MSLQGSDEFRRRLSNNTAQVGKRQDPWATSRRNRRVAPKLTDIKSLKREIAKRARRVQPYGKQDDLSGRFTGRSSIRRTFLLQAPVVGCCLVHNCGFGDNCKSTVNFDILHRVNITLFWHSSSH